jgi:hypothetical protein
VQSALDKSPLSGQVYLFRGRRGDLIKVLWHDGDGVCLLQKRLDRGKFVWPQATSGTVSLTRAQLSMLCEVCLPTSTGASWTVNGSRPEAVLSANSSGQDFEITHFLSPNANPNEFAPTPLPFGSPTWRSCHDGSVVWAKALTPPVSSGSDASCPNTGAIPCLLLQIVGSKPGPSGGEGMSQITFIQRLNTKGGSAPATGCSASTDVGKQTLVPYTADYYFFRKDK